MKFIARFAGVQIKYGVRKMLLTNILNENQEMFRDHLWIKLSSLNKNIKKNVLSKIKKKDVIVLEGKDYNYEHLGDIKKSINIHTIYKKDK